MKKMIISVSNEFFNENLNSLLLKDDFSINETILNFGTDMYLHQGDILKYISIDNETQSLKNQIKELNLKYQLSFEKKELDFNDTILKLNNDKDTILKNYEKSFQDLLLSTREQYEIKIKSLEFDLNKIQNEKNIEVNSLINISKDIVKSEYDKYVKIQDDIIKDLNTKLNDLNNFNMTLHSKNELLTERIFEMNKSIENSKFDSIISNFNVLNDKLSENFDKFYKTSYDKGAMGEQFIESYLSDVFTNCKIIRTCNDTSFGDLVFTFDKVCTLIESKNINYLKPFDIDKFYKDVEIRASKNEINSAILISLHNTNLVHGKRLFHFEMKYGIPIIMIADVFKNKEYIRFSISVFNYLIKNGFTSSETDNEKLSFILNTINEVYSLFKSQITFLNNDKATIAKMEDSFRKREMNLNDIDKLFKVIFSKCPEISSHDNKPKNTLDDILFKIKTYISTLPPDSDFKINIKNLEFIGISRNDIRTIGGIKLLHDSFFQLKL
jgi:hypothetical protein